LVQEVFMRLFRSLPALRDPSALSGFVFAITQRVIRAELKRLWLRRHLHLGTGRNASAEPAIECDHDARQAVQRLYDILDGLRPEARSLFVLRYIEELPVAEISEVTGLSFSTTKRRLDKAWRRVSGLVAGDPLLGEYTRKLRGNV
jgi:RNA polymerase sigma-70 factor (ECF subfamily)